MEKRKAAWLWVTIALLLCIGCGVTMFLVKALPTKQERALVAKIGSGDPGEIFTAMRTIGTGDIKLSAAGKASLEKALLAQLDSTNAYALRTVLGGLGHLESFPFSAAGRSRLQAKTRDLLRSEDMDNLGTALLACGNPVLDLINSVDDQPSIRAAIAKYNKANDHGPLDYSRFSLTEDANGRAHLGWERGGSR